MVWRCAYCLGIILGLITQNKLKSFLQIHFYRCVFSCFMIAHLFKDKQKVAGDINSLNLLVTNNMDGTNILK